MEYHTDAFIKVILASPHLFTRIPAKKLLNYAYHHYKERQRQYHHQICIKFRLLSQRDDTRELTVADDD